MKKYLAILVLTAVLTLSFSIVTSAATPPKCPPYNQGCALPW